MSNVFWSYEIFMEGWEGKFYEVYGCRYDVENVYFVNR